MPRTAVLSLVLMGTMTVAACAPGDVELNGKLFEAAGLSSSSRRSDSPKLADRAPLVLPPSLDRLPPPETASVAAADGAFPVDPEQRSVLSAGAAQQRQAAYCKENYEKALALGDTAKAATAKGPLGMCAPSAMQSLTGSNPLIQR